MSQTKILVVDDSRFIRKIVTSMLSKLGYNVLEAADGEEAVQAAVSERPDLILMDLQMPGVGGLEALHRLRAGSETGTIPVVILSGSEDETDRNRVLEAGGVDMLVKPFDPMQFQAKVNEYLGSR